MKHLFIINPAAGSRDRTKQYSVEIHEACTARNLDYRIEVSQAPGECRRIAREAAQTGEEYRIYACGGDGTLNEVASSAAGFDYVAVTVYSGGSGNDFVKLFDDPKAFFELDRLLDAEERKMDLIRCNDDISLPVLHGFAAYAASTVVNLFKGISEHYVVEVDGETIDGQQTFVCACNGQYYGGGFHPVPEADPTDGKLDILLVKKVSLLQVPAVIGKYKNGEYRKLSHLVRHFRTDSVKITCDKPSAVNLDGELRVAQTVDIRLADEKLRFFYPKGLRLVVAEPALTK